MFKSIKDQVNGSLTFDKRIFGYNEVKGEFILHSSINLLLFIFSIKEHNILSFFKRP
jgi:hypothetical protein